jgi:hypothetical protein
LKISNPNPNPNPSQTQAKPKIPPQPQEASHFTTFSTTVTNSIWTNQRIGKFHKNFFKFEYYWTNSTNQLQPQQQMGNSITFIFIEKISIEDKKANQTMSTKISLTLEEDNNFTIVAEQFTAGDAPGGYLVFKIIPDPHKFSQSIFSKLMLQVTKGTFVFTEGKIILFPKSISIDERDTGVNGVIEKITTGSRAHSKGEFKLNDKTWSLNSNFQVIQSGTFKHDEKCEFENYDFIKIELSNKDEKITEENVKTLDSVTFNSFFKIIPRSTGEYNCYVYTMVRSSDSNESFGAFVPGVFPPEMLFKKSK